jgi:hypothetical protein
MERMRLVQFHHPFTEEARVKGKEEKNRRIVKGLWVWGWAEEEISEIWPRAKTNFPKLGFNNKGIIRLSPQNPLGYDFGVPRFLPRRKPRK